MTDFRGDAQSIARLIGDALEQISDLLQTEIRLARAEMTEKATRAATGAGFVFGGCLLMVPTLVLLLIAFALFLVQQKFSPVTAHLIAALVGGGLSGVLIMIGLSRLKPSNLVPNATLEQVQNDINTAKELSR